MTIKKEGEGGNHRTLSITYAKQMARDLRKGNCI